MTPSDRAYLRAVLEAGLLSGPCLELGAGLPEHSAREMLLSAGLEYRSTDLEGDVDFRLDFEADDVTTTLEERFASVLVLNVLEHCFDPIRVLDNACRLVQPGGICLVITPSIWPVHSYPIDCWRPLPDFYREYARRRGLELLPEWFRYVGTNDRRLGALPPPGRSDAHRLYSRVVHKLFNTTGRGTWTRTHVAIGAALRIGGTGSRSAVL